MNIFVTGGAGFIGSHVCEALKDKHNVICYDNLDDYYSPKIKLRNVEAAGVKLTRGDILSKPTSTSSIRKNKPDVIIHLAAQPGVRASLQHPHKTNTVNVDGTLNILEAARKSDCKRIVFASSSSVYGNNPHVSVKESDTPNPISPYGVSKLACEHYLRVYNELYGIPYVALRYFTVYGPRIRPDLAIHKFTLAALADGELEVYGDGTKSRDITYVKDVVDATAKAITKGHGVYNIGGGHTVTVNELAENIIQIVGKGRIKYVPDQKGDVNRTASNCNKALGELGWMPKTELKEGLEETVRWIICSTK